jgi:hypothetical protein
VLIQIMPDFDWQNRRDSDRYDGGSEDKNIHDVKRACEFISIAAKKVANDSADTDSDVTKGKDQGGIPVTKESSVRKRPFRCVRCRWMALACALTVQSAVGLRRA